MVSAFTAEIQAYKYTMSEGHGIMSAERTMTMDLCWKFSRALDENGTKPWKDIARYSEPVWKVFGVDFMAYWILYGGVSEHEKICCIFAWY